jgi:hypothetical protein
MLKPFSDALLLSPVYEGDVYSEARESCLTVGEFLLAFRVEGLGRMLLTKCKHCKRELN